MTVRKSDFNVQLPLIFFGKYVVLIENVIFHIYMIIFLHSAVAGKIVITSLELLYHHDWCSSSYGTQACINNN